MKLIDITKENWLDVIFLTTRSDDMPTLCEEYVASNALSLLEAHYVGGWTCKVIENDGELVGFTMYGINPEENFYELCRFMIDKKYQGKGLGTQAIKLILDEMKSAYGCKEVYLSTEPDNVLAKHLYEKVGFVSENRQIDDEDLYKIVL